MKKIYLIAILSLFALVSLGQYTTTQTLGAPATNVKSRGGLAVDSSYTQGGFTDTAAANLGFIKNIPFTQIRIGTNYWMRNSSATRWILITGGSGTICAGLQSGGNVAWTNTGLIFSVTEALYCINGSSYHSPTTNITLNAADPSLPRLDVLAVDVNNNVVKITGTPSATPSVPTVDPLTQLYLTAILVPAGATTPGGITTTIIYDENTEWATSSNLTAGTVNFNSTSNPFHLIKNAVLSSTASGTISFQQTSLSLNLSSYNNITLYVKMDAPSMLTLSAVILNNGASTSTSSIDLSAYGFNQNITTYQTITIPISAFPVISNIFNGFLLKTTTTGTTVHVDYIQLQSGMPSGSSPYITNVRRRSGTDTVEVQKNGIWQYAFIDSTGGGGTNIYNSDGTLSGNRVVSTGSNNLTFSNSLGNSGSTFIKRIGSSSDSSYLQIAAGTGSSFSRMRTDNSGAFAELVTIKNGSNPTVALRNGSMDAGLNQTGVFIHDGTEGLNKVLTSDAVGNATWQTSSSYTNIDNLDSIINRGRYSNAGQIRFGGTDDAGFATALGGFGLTLNNGASGISNFTGGRIQLFNGTNGDANLYGHTQSGNTYRDTLPRTSGILANSVNGVKADVNGNINFVSDSLDIPLQGTYAGKPVTGDIELSGAGLISTDGSDVAEIRLDAGEPRLTSTGTAGFAYMSIGQTAALITSNITGYRGIGSGQDFSANVTNLDYPQLIKVKSALHDSLVRYPDSIRRVALNWQYRKNSNWITYGTDSLGTGGGSGIDSVRQGNTTDTVKQYSSGTGTKAFLTQRVFNVKNFGAVGNGVTDDRDAIQAAINACYAAGGGVVYFPNGIYLIHGALVNGGGTGVGSPNSQLYLPYETTITGTGFSRSIKLLGETPPSTNASIIGDYAINRSGAILYSDITGSGSIPSIFGSDGLVTLSGLNIAHITVEGLTFRVKANISASGPTMSALNLGKIAFGEVKNVVCDLDTSLNRSVLPVDSTYGIIMPGHDNGAWSPINNTLVGGYKNGYAFSEHSTGSNVNALACVNAFTFNPFGGAAHDIYFGRLLAQECKNIIVGGNDATVTISDLDIEHIQPPDSRWFTMVYAVNDPGNTIMGHISYHMVEGGGTLGNSKFFINGGGRLFFKFIDDNTETLLKANNVSVGNANVLYSGYNGISVGGTATNSVLTFTDHNVLTGQFYTSTSDINFYTGTGKPFNLYTNNSLSVPLIYASANQRVGINKVSPSETLDVAGNVRFSGALMPNNAAGTSGQHLVSAGTGAPPVWKDTTAVIGGTYTPTLSNTTNVSSSTAIICHYTRVGNQVTVTGSAGVVATLAVATVLSISLPVASNLAAVTDVAGVGQASSAVAANAFVQGNSTSDLAELTFTGLSVGGAGTIYFTFTYTIL